MQPTTMRPTFVVSISVSADEAMDRIRQQLREQGQWESSASVGRCAELFVAAGERRVWSPHLSIHAEEAESGCVLHGRFSPRPEIWTMLMFLYFTVISVAFFATMFGCAQWMIKQSPWALSAAPIGTVIVIALHVISLIGQRLGRKQMRELRDRLDMVLHSAFSHEGS